MEVRYLNVMRDLFETRSSYEIPVYQRNYDWKKDQCEALIDSITKAYKNEVEEYFFGSFVLVNKEHKSYYIIDGQQRMTTITLLLLAIRDYMEKNEIADVTYIDDYIFSDKTQSTKSLILKQIKKDNEFLHKIVNNMELNTKEEESSNIIQNYIYFQKELEINKDKYSELYNGLKLLKGVCIELNKKDNPQNIFETLNATGLELKESDKIRNYILMGEKKQEELYNDYWVPIEKNCKLDDNEEGVSELIRFYLTVKMFKSPNQNKVYTTFKKHLEDKNNKDILKKLLKYSEYYNEIIDSSDEYDEYMQFYRKFKMTVIYPFLLLNFDYVDQKYITKKTYGLILELLENYIIRRMICGIASNALNKIVIGILSRYNFFFMDTTKSEEDYLEDFKKTLYKKQGSSQFPKDKMFKSSFLIKEFYRSRTKEQGFYILKKLENYMSKEKIVEEDLTIEHIMPQKLSEGWYEDLENLGLTKHEIDEKHSQYKDRIGNLSLTAYNSEMSNHKFDEKKRYIIENSKVKYLNESILSENEWTFEIIDRRGDQLFAELIKIYPYDEEMESSHMQGWYPLIGELDSFTDISIKKYRIDEKIVPVDTWSSFLEIIIGYIYKKDKVKFRKFLLDSNDFKFWLSTDNEVLGNKIEDSFYLYTKRSTNAKVIFLEKVLDKLGLNDMVIDVYLDFPNKEGG